MNCHYIDCTDGDVNCDYGTPHYSDQQLVRHENRLPLLASIKAGSAKNRNSLPNYLQMSYALQSQHQDYVFMVYFYGQTIQ